MTRKTRKKAATAPKVTEMPKQPEPGFFSPQPGEDAAAYVLRVTGCTLEDAEKDPDHVARCTLRKSMMRSLREEGTIPKQSGETFVQIIARGTGVPVFAAETMIANIFPALSLTAIRAIPAEE